jgi:hypothetical protein
MMIRSWAGGLALFAVFYTIMIVYMSVQLWPSMRNPSINIMLTKSLPAESQTLIYRIEKTRQRGAEGGPSYKILPQEYSVRNSSPKIYLDTIHMINGHVLVFQAGSSTAQIEEVAEQYTAILLEHQIQETTNAIVRLIATLFIPIFTTGLFAWAGNKLWRAIEKMD